MLFILENNSDIQTYFRLANFPALAPYFNSSSTGATADFLSGKLPLSIHKFLLIDMHSLEGIDLKKFKNNVAEFFGVAYFYRDRASLNTNLFKDLITDNVVGVFDLSLPRELNLPMEKSLSRAINVDSDLITPEDLKELGEDLNIILSKVEKEMLRVKKIHSHLMPKRTQHFKNMEVESKFATGEASGGEFFDLFESNNKVLFFLSSSNSYLTSSITLGTFNELKGKELSLEAIQGALKDLQGNFKTLQETKNKKILKLELLVGVLNLKTMQFEGYNFGTNSLITSNKKSINVNEYPVDKSFLEKAKFSLQLERGEKLALVSAGLKKNCLDYLDGQGYLEFIARGFNSHKADLLNEVFFQLRKNVASEFLNYDATMINITVDKSALIEV